MSCCCVQLKRCMCILAHELRSLLKLCTCIMINSAPTRKLCQQCWSSHSQHN